MPVSADTERQLLNHYKLTSLYPDTWPHRGNESSEDEDDEESASGTPQVRHVSNRSTSSRTGTSKYQRINRHVSLSSTPRDSESLVQRDEPDPLGVKPSVAVELKRKGLPVEENLKLRNRFMLSSTSFSPALFLSHVHQEASTDDLLRGLEFLSNSIEQKSASLKVLVESNFDKFVKAKATIDNVYTEMRAQGSADPSSPPTSTGPLPGGGRRPHSRHTSKGSHFRNTSAQLFSTAKPSSPTDKKKNALTKESEYGVQGIKVPLQEVAIRAEEVWGPVLGGREKEETLKSVLTTIEQNQDIFRLNGNMAEAIRKNDYDTIVALARQARKHAAEARSVADNARANTAQLGDVGAQQIIITAKMWHDVNGQITAFRQTVWRRLKTSQGRKPAAVVEGTDKEEHMELISVLLQLGVDPEENNPIWEWLHSRYLYLKDKVLRLFERSRIEIEVLRRRLAGQIDKFDSEVLANHLRCVSAAQTPLARLSGRDAKKEVDAPSILAFWEKEHTCLATLLSNPTGVIGEVVEYWETTQGFINNTAQKAFPLAVFATGSDYLELEPDDVANLRSGVTELVDMIRDSIMSFFSDPPVQDLSDLYSPISPTPTTPDANSMLTPGGSKRSFPIDPSNIPPPSPQKGDAWEKFAFWPPQANSLGGSFHLARILTLVGTAAADMASMTVVKQSRGSEALKTLVGSVRERCVQAVCAAWITDAERCKVLETWTRSSDRHDLTTFPASFATLMERLLGDVQKIAYVSDAVSARGSTEVIVPPPTKLLQTVRSTFVTCLYKALSGMVENAEKAAPQSRWESDPDGVTKAKGMLDAADNMTTAVESSSKNVRTLLTLSNLAHLRAETIPHLIAQFESTFSVKLTDETKNVHDLLNQIDTKLFQSYVSPTVDLIHELIQAGVTSPSWAPPSTSGASARPENAKPYIYDVLLALVLVHTEVSSTAGTLTTPVLSHLLEQASLSLITAFKKHARYGLPALMQATLDVEFLAQTLNAFSTDRAGDLQSQVYLALDERTDNDARARLQAELPEMRAVLKRLRERTRGEFGCFRRERRGRENRSGSGR